MFGTSLPSAISVAVSIPLSIAFGVLYSFKFAGPIHAIRLYFDKLAARKIVYLRYRLRAAHPQKVTAPPSEAYEYYASDVRARTPATVLTVQ